VWRLCLQESRATPELHAQLSEEERERAGRFVFPADQRRYGAAHGQLRQVLAAYLGGSPAQLAFHLGPQGKPRLAARSELSFNLSHSGDLGLLAVSFGREVGIDTEAIRPVPDLDGLVARCFSGSERSALASVPEELRLTVFFEAWTRKEAFLKALGDGLSRPLQSFDVSLLPGQPARLLSLDGDPAASRAFALRALRPGSGFVGAVAVQGPEARLRCREWPSQAEIPEMGG
jgi:4'-phosphopantetheinyl transferase